MARECVMCGQPVKGFGTRGINKQLRRTMEMTERIRAAARKVEDQGPLSEGGDAGPLLETLNRMAAEGDSYAEFWHDALHDIDVPNPSEARVIKREWVQWGKSARPMLGLVELPPATLAQVLSQNR
jgi:hypothetical protein